MGGLALLTNLPPSPHPNGAWVSWEVPKGSAALHPAGMSAVGLGAVPLTPAAVTDMSCQSQCPAQCPGQLPREAHLHGSHPALQPSPSLCPPLPGPGLGDGDTGWMLRQQHVLGSAWIWEASWSPQQPPLSPRSRGASAQPPKSKAAAAGCIHCSALALLPTSLALPA